MRRTAQPMKRDGWAPRWAADPVLWIFAVTAVLFGTFVGLSAETPDVDERVYRMTLELMQDGEAYYEATVDALIAKDGLPPTQVRSVRTPVVAHLVAPFPEWLWRWLAVIPAFALIAACALLAGPDSRARRIAAALSGLWIVVSLPRLYLHQELWGAALVMFAAAAVASRRDGVAAGLCLLATAMRELYGLSLLVGLVMGRDRRPWGVALLVAGAGAALHLHWADGVLGSDGYEPPLEATDPIWHYLSPGDTPLAGAIGAVLLAAAAAGAWRHRHRLDLRFALASTVPILVAGVLAGRSYWSLVWCGPVSVAAALVTTTPERAAAST